MPYGKRAVLDIKSLSIRAGGVIGLVGPNGSGKSTLLKMLAFLTAPSSGEMLFMGSAVSGRERELRREATLLLQDPYLLRTSVRRNLTYGLSIRGVRGDEAERRVADALGMVGLSREDFANRKWFRLSGGEARRVALASRLALHPKILLLDEPTANMDEASAEKIKHAMSRACEEYGSTVVVATHDTTWLHETATEIIGMYAGRAIADGAANLLPGDWRCAPEGGNLAAISFGDRKIFAAAPPCPDALACAALNPSDVQIALCGAGNDAERRAAVAASDEAPVNALEGLITQMSLERSRGEVLVAVNCGGVTLRARVNRQTAEKLFPGAQVNLYFSAAALTFI
ncbi:MAG: ATP-binding cassette domain-containing protein [Acidobacteriota bacterium]|nr:ATP-binding cassette domain-containing protein [Acidobacteriota bacterium]